MAGSLADISEVVQAGRPILRHRFARRFDLQPGFCGFSGRYRLPQKTL